MDANDICFLSIADASELIATGKLSPVELVSAHLDRIEEIGGPLNAFITLLADESLAAATEAEAEIRSGNCRGPLHGIPIGLKDLFYTRGIRTTAGSKILSDFIPDYDAGVVVRLRDAGAIMIGKLQMQEFGLGVTGENPHYGPARNPWDTLRVAGGSSGGSGLAVAAGLSMGALGSDTGGSVRIPASLCGVVGLKPTFGRISRIGMYPAASSLDTAGLITRTVHDAALVLNAIAGHDTRDPASSSRDVEDFAAGLVGDITGTRIGVPKEHFFSAVDPDVHSAVMGAAGVLEGLGASVEEVSIPLSVHAPLIVRTISNSETAEVHTEHLRSRPDDFEPRIRSRLEAGSLTPATQYLKAQRARSTFNRQVNEVLRTVDLLLTPTTPVAATKIGETSVTVRGKSFSPLTLLRDLTSPFNLTGLPAASIPCGFTTDGLPIGLHLAARPFAETALLGTARAYEQATNWHLRRPL